MKFHNINEDDIIIVVSEHDRQLDDYLTLKNVLVTKANKIGEVHNFITGVFDEGDFICELDDDVKDIVDKDLEPIPDFQKLIDTAKDLCIENQCSYCGTYSVLNKMFMKGTQPITTDLRYCLGLVRFRFVRKEIQLETNYSEDFENCILHYKRDGKIVRMNHICGKTKNYAPGGCDGSGRNYESEKADKEFLATKYPKYTTLFQRKNKRWDLRLKDKTPTLEVYHETGF